MSTHKPFSQELMSSLLKTVDLLQKQTPGPHYAAFDADGTLWSNDVGENFFQYQIDHCGLKSLANIDPWKHYEDLKKKHPPEAYLWLAQLCAGFSVEEVRQWATAAAQKNPPDVFTSQQELIKQLLHRDIHILVVSASVHWAVEGALPAIGLSAKNALGVRTRVENGVVTSHGEGSVTWREGKREALLAATNGVRPLLSCGNSSGDIHLLESSVGVALAVQSQTASSAHPKLYADEQHLLKLAHQHQWLTHSFV